ncbi:hypothetical protein L6269_01105, partial [Candidatus Dependentiae bacterium]|nr:hypothetical protein [Candidatus Dependentiae bacterium]MCG2756078.1 hypothetical protein [Candidatus Dependentiae bacterium]
IGRGCEPSVRHPLDDFLHIVSKENMQRQQVKLIVQKKFRKFQLNQKKSSNFFILKLKPSGYFMMLLLIICEHKKLDGFFIAQNFE